MAKNSIRDYSATSSSNTDVQSVNIDENCPASGINNAIREVMVDLKNVSTGAIALESPKFDSILDGNIKATDAAGTDAAGTATTIKGGAGTGTGAGGSIAFQVAAPAGSTGSSVNAHATAMTITDVGNVGIGSANPLSDLSVESSIGGVLTLSTSDTTGTSGDSLGKIDFYSGDTSTGSTGVQARISGVYDSNGDSTALTFTTGTSTGSGSPTIAEHLRITATGQIRTTNRDFGFHNHLTTVSLADDASIVINAGTAGVGMLVIYETASGTNGLYRIGYLSSAILSATGSVTLSASDTDGAICVFSSGHTITIKNRVGATKAFYINTFMAGNNF